MNTLGLEEVKTFDQLLPWLRDQLDWPIDEIEIDDEPLDNLTFEYDAAKDLGLRKEDVAHIREIRQLRPFVTGQPWGIFFVSFEDKKIPLGVLKRLLGGLTLKKRQSANKAEQRGWALHDLLFISAHGRSGQRELSFLHFSEENGGKNKIILKELGWDQFDTKLKLDYVANTLKSKLAWPDDQQDAEAWRRRWAAAFSSRHRAAISTAKALTKQLAELATAIRKSANDVLAFENKNGPLTTIYESFRKTIFHNLTPDDFADMYAQTICYGLLAARIMRHSNALVADDAALIAPLTQPFLKDLMETFLAVGGRKSRIDFNELGVDEVVDALLYADMDAVRLDFGNRNPNEDPILHFYEHFLRDYDSIKREQRGVYYTPLPVVRFIVRSVDEVLQKEFDLQDGLADPSTWGDIHKKNPAIVIPPGVSPDAPFVQILDPAVGTGTFLVETIDLIAERMKAKWSKAGRSVKEVEALWNDYVPKHLLPRLNGFELMMAPYAIAHIKIAMKLHETGYRPKSESGPRVQVYLTNTLEEAIGLGDQSEMGFIVDSLALEAKGADAIKTKSPITVIVGNPPYSGHSMNNGISWIVERVQDYRREFPDLQKPGQGKWLQDDYVKFIRYSEGRISNVGRGVLGFITNHAYLDNPTFKGMRKHLMGEFQKLWLLDLHGNLKKREIAADGSRDENVFAIQQGVAITLGQRASVTGGAVFRADVLGKATVKGNLLYSSTLHECRFERVDVRPPLWVFESRDCNIDQEYHGFIRVSDIFAPNGDPAPGIVTTHDEFAISWSPEEAAEKVRLLCSTATEGEARTHFKLCGQNQWSYRKAKATLAANGSWEREIVPVLYRPFDVRVTVFNSHVAVHRRERVMRHMLGVTNIGICIGRAGAVIGPELWSIVFATTSISELNLFRRGGNCLFPLFLVRSDTETSIRPNVSDAFVQLLGMQIGLQYDNGTSVRLAHSMLPGIGIERPVQGALHLADPKVGRGDLCKIFGPRDAFDYIYAVLHSRSYRERYADFLKSDFPRIPIPRSATLFRHLVALGRQLAALHTVNCKEAVALNSPDTRFVGKGEALVEKGFPKYVNGKVMINDGCWFEDVTDDVWSFRVGGYRVCEKWLEDRAGKGGKKPRPGRVLSDDDILHYRRVTVAIKETIALMKQIDETIAKHGGWPGAFASTAAKPN